MPRFAPRPRVCIIYLQKFWFTHKLNYAKLLTPLQSLQLPVKHSPWCLPALYVDIVRISRRGFSTSKHYHITTCFYTQHSNMNLTQQKTFIRNLIIIILAFFLALYASLWRILIWCETVNVWISNLQTQRRTQFDAAERFAKFLHFRQFPKFKSLCEISW